MKLSLKSALLVIPCCLVGCGRPKWRQHRKGSGFYIRLRINGSCKCVD